MTDPEPLVLLCWSCGTKDEKILLHGSPLTPGRCENPQCRAHGLVTDSRNFQPVRAHA